MILYMNKSLKERVAIIQRKLIADDRGWFLKAITGTEKDIPSHTGEVYLTMGKPGQAKGGHYHPEALEWFTIIEGNAVLKLEDIETHERLDIPMSLDKAITVFIPNNVAHIVVNNSDKDFILLAYTDKLYDPKDTIVYEIER
jgi:dTDP-4-dehydrorhamnose 3,5-epimerase-like enzyme